MDCRAALATTGFVVCDVVIPFDRTLSVRAVNELLDLYSNDGLFFSAEKSSQHQLIYEYI